FCARAGIFALLVEFFEVRLGGKSMLNNLLSNPVTRTFFALVFAIVAVLGSFFTYVTAPEDFGNTSVQFDVDSIYYFADSWKVAYDYAEITFFSGTLVIPAYHHGR